MAALTLGIIGGIAPESTIEYYRTIIALHRERTGGQYPTILINSIDLKKMLALVAEQRFPELITYLVAEIRKLAAGGATIGLFASNTPHIVFDELRRRHSERPRKGGSVDWLCLERASRCRPISIARFSSPVGSR